MFHIYFLGSSEGLLFDVPGAPFPAALWEPLAALLGRHGAELRTATPVEHVEPLADGGHVVTTARDERRHDTVVLALDAAGLRGLVERSERLGDAPWRERVARLRNAPPFLVSRLWLDRPVASDRPGFLGTSGYGSLDNVTVLERYEDEAARWASRTGGSVVELHAYALPAGSAPEVEQKRLLDQLHRVYPETRRAGIVDARHEWAADCPLFPVGGYEDRPTVRTPTGGGDGRRPDPHLAARRPHGTRGDHRIPGGERLAGTLGRTRPDPLDGPRPRPQRTPTGPGGGAGTPQRAARGLTRRRPRPRAPGDRAARAARACVPVAGRGSCRGHGAPWPLAAPRSGVPRGRVRRFGRHRGRGAARRRAGRRGGGPGNGVRAPSRVCGPAGETRRARWARRACPWGRCARGHREAAAVVAPYPGAVAAWAGRRSVADGGVPDPATAPAGRARRPVGSAGAPPRAGPGPARLAQTTVSVTAGSVLPVRCAAPARTMDSARGKSCRCSPMMSRPVTSEWGGTLRADSTSAVQPRKSVNTSASST